MLLYLLFPSKDCSTSAKRQIIKSTPIMCPWEVSTGRSPAWWTVVPLGEGEGFSSLFPSLFLENAMGVLWWWSPFNLNKIEKLGLCGVEVVCSHSSQRQRKSSRRPSGTWKGFISTKRFLVVESLLCRGALMVFKAAVNLYTAWQRSPYREDSICGKTKISQEELFFCTVT